MPDERPLASDEVERMACTHVVRKTIVDPLEYVRDTERVTFSDEFGYIYRYDRRETVLDGSREFIIETVLVVWTQDRETFCLATYPQFELPRVDPPSGADDTDQSDE
jgi:hypothetical protein